MIEIDPISGQRWPADRSLWKARQFIEQIAVKGSARAVFVTTGARHIYAERYPEFPSTHWAVIANGYEEEDFAVAEQKARAQASERSQTVLLHSGTLYPTPDRDIGSFLSALATLRHRGIVSANTLRIVLRASGHDEYHRPLLRQYAVEDMVGLEPAIPYRDALAEMLNADGLLLFQGHDSNPAIPAKLYEYFRARRPIFALVDSEGETAKTLHAAGLGSLGPLNSPDAIATRLKSFLHQLKDRKAPVADLTAVKTHSRDSRALELARLFDDVGT
jgi:hypothetical protein